MNRSLLSALFGSAILLSAADPLTDVFARMDKTAQKFMGMTANIQETVHTEIVNDNTISTGTIKLRRAKPNDMGVLVEFTNPDAPRSVELSGAKAYLYNPKTKTEQEYDVANNQHIMEQLFELGFGATSSEIKQNYEVTWVGSESIDGKPTSHLKLIPKSADVLQKLKQADLWISDSLGMPVQQKLLTTASGDYTVFKYSNLKIANSLSDNDLKLKVPKGIQAKRVGN
jgi:outer membrane lipoprotein-sorting protein